MLSGSGGADLIKGAAGDDVLDGGVGNDRLEGDLGADVFRFDTALGAGNVDTLTDFTAADDQIQLSAGVFTATATAAGSPLGAGEFLSGAGVTAATAAAQRIIFNTTTGELFYDPDGNLTTGDEVLFAELGAGTPLAAADIDIIA